MKYRAKLKVLICMSLALVVVYFLHDYCIGFTPTARKGIWERVYHSPKKSGQHPLVRSFDTVIGYRSSPICAWDNHDGQIPSLDPHPKVVIRSVFLDDRTRDGHQNASVFLLEVEKVVIQENLIVSCQIDGRNATSFAVRDPGQNKAPHRICPNLTHDVIAVDCFDLPVTNGTKDAILFFRSEPSGVVKKVNTLEPLMIPGPHRDGRQHNFSIVTCMAVLYGTPPLLDEVIRYQKTIGVDHVHMIAEPSILASGALDYQFVKESLANGFASLRMYKTILNQYQIYDHSQTLAYHECFLQFRGTYDYIMYIDTDDFFVPRVSNQKTLHYYIEKWCRIGSCRFEWLQFYPDCGLKPGKSIDGNVTDMLNSTLHIRRALQKSIHMLNDLVDVGTHTSYKLLQGKSVKVPPSDAVVAHIRKNSPFPSNKNCSDTGYAGTDHDVIEHLNMKNNQQTTNNK